MRAIARPDLAALIVGLATTVKQRYQLALELMLACLPRWFAQRTVWYRPILIVRPLGETADLSIQTPAGTEHLDTVSKFQLRSGALRSTLVAFDISDVWIELPEQRMLYRHARLPAQVAKQLRRAVLYEIDRLTPFDSADVYYDVFIKKAIGQGSSLEVMIAVCHKQDIDPWLTGMTATSGYRVAGIRSLNPWSNMNLLPPEQRPHRSLRGLVIRGMGYGLPLLLLAAVMITPIWQTASYERLLNAEVVRFRSLVERESQLKDQLAALRQENATLLETRRTQPKISDLLRSLTDAMPDSSYLLNLSYRDGQLEIRGEASNSAELIGQLERNQDFSGAVFRSPVTTIAAEEKERFHIHLDVERGPPP